MTAQTSAEPDSATSAGAGRPARPRRRREHVVPVGRGETRGAWTLMAPYVLLLLVAGVIPIVNALITALQTPPTALQPEVTFGGVQSFKTVFTDFR
ncbi:MAG: hypothetical protein ABI776_04060, partial [Nocardioidaceae bacterium]